ncbi:MAG: cupin domain-containing protein [Candidatus Binatia bacterium]|nr:cupin domain-containing protein [Candidatus Binatia bacterium]
MCTRRLPFFATGLWASLCATSVILSGCSTRNEIFQAQSQLLVARPNSASTISALLDDATHNWTDKPIEARELCSLGRATVQLVRILGAEEPHDHPDHDLLVVLLRGGGSMALADRTVPLQAGDVVVIEHGARHAFRNHHRGGSLALVVRLSPAAGGEPSIR